MPFLNITLYILLLQFIKYLYFITIITYKNDLLQENAIF